MKPPNYFSFQVARANLATMPLSRPWPPQIQRGLMESFDWYSDVCQRCDFCGGPGQAMSAGLTYPLWWCAQCHIGHLMPEPEPDQEPAPNPQSAAGRDYFAEDVAAQENVAPRKHANLNSCKPCYYRYGQMCTIAPQVWVPTVGWSYPPAVYRCKDYASDTDMAEKVTMWRAQEG